MLVDVVMVLALLGGADGSDDGGDDDIRVGSADRDGARLIEEVVVLVGRL